MSEDEAATKGVWSDGNIGAAVGAVEVEDEIVRQSGCVDQRCAFDGKDDGGFEQAGDGFGVGGAKRRGDCSLDCGKTDDDDGLWDC